MSLPTLFYVGDERIHVDPYMYHPKVLKKFYLPFLNLLSYWPIWAVIKCGTLTSILDFKNAYFDTAATNSELDRVNMEKMIELLGVDRIIYGSDFPWFDCKIEFDGIEELSISEKDKRKILWENSARILGNSDKS